MSNTILAAPEKFGEHTKDIFFNSTQIVAKKIIFCGVSMKQGHA